MNRNLTAAFKYQIKDNVKSIIVYYCILFAVLILFYIGAIISSSFGETTTGGLDVSTTIFIFIAGLCSFKEPFKMLMQNGVSRKTMMKSKIITALALALFMAFCTTLLCYFGKLLTSTIENYNFYSTYEQAYTLKAAGQTQLAIQLSSFVFNFLQYLALYIVGLFISLMFYRLGKAGKITVGAGVPVFCFIVLPIIDAMYFKMQVSKNILRFLNYAFGLTSGKPGAAFISLVVIALLGLGLSWLLMRKADIKQ